MAMTGGVAKLVKTGTLNYGNLPATVKLYVYYKSTQDIANNRSTVYCGMYFVVTDGYHIGEWSDSGSYVGTKTNTFTKKVPYTGGTYWLAENKTLTVDHNSDGTGKATIYWKWGVNSPWGQMVTPSGSFTITLPTIARTSSVSATNAYIGDKPTIKISRQDDSFTHTLQYKIKGQDSYKTIVSKTTATSYTSWAIPTSAYNYLSSTGKTVKITIKCITYNGSTKIGSKTCDIVATGKDSVLKPNTPTLTASDENGFEHIYIKGKSSVKLTSNRPSTKYGATISSYIWTGENIKNDLATDSGTRNSKISSIIKSYGKKTYTVQVKDSRGILSEKEKVTINVKNYFSPTVAIGRITSTEGETRTITVPIITTHCAVGTNSITLTLNSVGGKTASKISGPTSSTDAASGKTTTEYTYQYTGLDPSTTGNITATIHDSVYPSKTISKSAAVLSSSRAINISKYGNGVAIGGISSVTSSTASGKFECNWKTLFKKGVHIENSIVEYFTIDRNNVLTGKDANGIVRKKHVRGEFYISNPENDDAALTCRRRTRLETDSDWSTTSYWRLTGDRFYVDNPISANGTIYSNGKTNAYDGNKGAAIGSNGRIYLTGEGSGDGTSGIVFVYNKGKSDTASILEVESGLIKVEDSLITVNNGGYQSYKNKGTTKFNLIKLNQHNNIVIGDINDSNTDGTASKTFIGGVYNYTTGKSANTYIGSKHQLWRTSSSSQRYKTDILPIQSDALSPDKLYDLPVREFKYKEGYLSDEDRLVDTPLPGFIAEEVDEFYPIACEYDESDRPENWNIRIMVPPMLKLIQDQHEEIELLKLRVEQQQKEIEALRTEVDNMKNK